MTTKEELYYNQKQIDTMTDDEINEVNEKIKEYSREQFSIVQQSLSRYSHIMSFYIKEWHKSSKSKNTFWRYRAAVELVLMKSGLEIKKLTTGFKILLGDIDKDLYQVELVFDKFGDNTNTTRWRRVYQRTKIRTPEEQEAYNKEIQERIRIKDKKQFEANCSKWDLTKDIFGETFKHKNGNLYTITGCNPRNAKFPLNCDIVNKEKPEDSGAYKIALRLFKELKQVKRVGK